MAAHGKLVLLCLDAFRPANYWRAENTNLNMNLISQVLMRRYPLMASALLALQPCVSTAQASELSGVATITSEYIYRGLAMSDGKPSAQLGFDYEHDTGE